MDKQNKIVGVVGRKGSGKSTILRAIARKTPRLFVFDSMGEHDWVVDTITDLLQVRTYLEQDVKPGEPFHARYVPYGEVMEEFDEVADAVYDTGSMTFGIEELPMLTKSAGYMQPSLGRLFRLGRHRALNFIWTAQRAAEVPRGVTGATDIFILFQQTEPGDIKAIAYRCGDECARMVENLGLHDFLIFDVVTRKITEMDDFKNTKDMEKYLCGLFVHLNTSPENSNYRTRKRQPHLWEGVSYGNSEQ